MIYHFIKVNRLKNDIRIQRWTNTFNDWELETIIYGYVLNKEDWIQGKVKIFTREIWFRKFFKIGSGRIFKVPEVAISVLSRIIRIPRNSVVVYHDNQLYLSILIHTLFKTFFKHKLVWDMHELPHDILLKNPVSRNVLKFMLSRIDHIIITNQHRADYLNQILDTKLYLNVLNNFPSKSELLKEEKKQLPKEIISWLNGEHYALWMGVPSDSRNFKPFYYSCLKNSLKIIILGKTIPETEYLNEDPNCMILFVNPSEFNSYIDSAYLTATFYRGDKPNNLYCEPNRLYLLISRGVNIISGNNPTLSNVLMDYKKGIILNSDTPNELEILSHINSFSNEPKNDIEYGINFLILNGYIWEEQIKNLKYIFIKNERR